MSLATYTDPREFAEGVIYDSLKSYLGNEIPVYRGSKPQEDDPDFYISILSEQEDETMPMDGVFILDQSIVLVSVLGAKSGEDHVRYRSLLRTAIFQLMGIRNYLIPDKGKFFGTFAKSASSADARGRWGDIFHLETRVAVVWKPE